MCDYPIATDWRFLFWECLFGPSTRFQKMAVDKRRVIEGASAFLVSDDSGRRVRMATYVYSYLMI